MTIASLKQRLDRLESDRLKAETLPSSRTSSLSERLRNSSALMDHVTSDEFDRLWNLHQEVKATGKYDSLKPGEGQPEIDAMLASLIAKAEARIAAGLAPCLANYPELG